MSKKRNHPPGEAGGRGNGVWKDLDRGKEVCGHRRAVGGDCRVSAGEPVPEGVVHKRPTTSWGGFRRSISRRPGEAFVRRTWIKQPACRRLDPAERVFHKILSGMPIEKQP